MMKIIISGKGGQGIQFFAMLLAKNAIHNGKQVTLMKSYGPEARGGSSQCSLVIDDKPITNPIVKKANYLIAFSKDAVDMWGPRAQTIIYHDDMNNMEMLGIFIKTIGEDLDSIIKTMGNIISNKYQDRLEQNIKNLQKGYSSNDEK